MTESVSLKHTHRKPTPEQTGIPAGVIKEIRDLAEKHRIISVILFGSRARGDFGRASDIDLAVRGKNTDRFALDVDEETSTPLKYDIVNLDKTVRKELLESIAGEGIVLYEKI